MIAISTPTKSKQFMPSNQYFNILIYQTIWRDLPMGPCKYVGLHQNIFFNCYCFLKLFLYIYIYGWTCLNMGLVYALQIVIWETNKEPFSDTSIYIYPFKTLPPQSGSSACVCRQPRRQCRSSRAGAWRWPRLYIYMCVCVHMYSIHPCRCMDVWMRIKTCVNV